MPGPRITIRPWRWQLRGERLQSGIPATVAGLHRVVRDCAIPPEHYHSFLDAMRRDAAPQPFATLDALITDYIYGSAIVVGYFLAYVYGASGPGEFNRTLVASRDLGIALHSPTFCAMSAKTTGAGASTCPSICCIAKAFRIWIPRMLTKPFRCAASCKPCRRKRRVITKPLSGIWMPFLPIAALRFRPASTSTGS